MERNTSSSAAIGGILDDSEVRKNCLRGDDKFRNALIAAGYMAPVAAVPVKAAHTAPSQPEREPLPGPEPIEALQTRITELEAALKIGGVGQFRAQKIAIAVARKHGLKFSDLRGPSRERHVVAARHEAIKTIRRECNNLSLPAIGRIFNRDHTTVLYVVRGGKGWKRNGKLVAAA
jgi:hypothetical protein